MFLFLFLFSSRLIICPFQSQFIYFFFLNFLNYLFLHEYCWEFPSFYFPKAFCVIINWFLEMWLQVEGGSRRIRVFLVGGISEPLYRWVWGKRTLAPGASRYVSPQETLLPPSNTLDPTRKGFSGYSGPGSTASSSNPILLSSEPALKHHITAEPVGSNYTALFVSWVTPHSPLPPPNKQR